jgi:hypothetical protein
VAAWLTVFNRQPVGASISADAITAAIEETDLYMAAEAAGIDDDAAVDAALSHLSVLPVDAKLGVQFDVRYGDGDQRPVQIHVWAEPARVRIEQSEAESSLEGVPAAASAAVRSRLRETVEVIGIELGWGQLEDMGIVLAGQVAELFAATGDGLIRDSNDDWWEMRNGVPHALLRRTGDA